MNYDKLSGFRFWNRVDEALTRKTFSGKRRISLYPSEASVIGIDPETKEASVIGKCHRAVFYRLTGEPESNPSGIKSQYIFAFGNAVEKFIADLTKVGGFFSTSSVKFWDQESFVSGEVDIVVNHPDGGFIMVEVKSTYGYQNESVLIKQNKPKDDHLLQLTNYLFLHRDNPDLIGGKLVYLLRDNMSRNEFDVVVVYDEAAQKHRIVVNGKVDERFYVEDMYDRYSTIRNVINRVKQGEDIIPEREYMLLYPDATIEAKWEKGEIAKTTYEKFKKSGERPGDWRCSYCSYKDTCWTQDAIKDLVGTNTIKIVKKRVAA